MKTCGRCNQEKDESCFNKKGKGLTSHCKECLKEYRVQYCSNPVNYAKHIKTSLAAREIRKKKYTNIINNLKSVPCADCKNSFDPICMDFDHLDGKDKEYNVSRMVSETHSLTNILNEIAKCEVVCSNCHRLRTLHRRTNAGVA